MDKRILSIYSTEYDTWIELTFEQTEELIKLDRVMQEKKASLWKAKDTLCQLESEYEESKKHYDDFFKRFEVKLRAEKRMDILKNL